MHLEGVRQICAEIRYVKENSKTFYQQMPIFFFISVYSAIREDGS